MVVGRGADRAAVGGAGGADDGAGPADDRGFLDMAENATLEL